ncbi:uncharacterized protein LOC132925118 [Rhopalosiphum padi]|uniref:uncharacterized protein LOC132925118 n=1 Tax=Rhopalosiphum padi TaxID=40932 RepID=UPI00298D726D|nr:uncharacterized protein LOC132925118 [Rhopalosiphum padi]
MMPIAVFMITTIISIISGGADTQTNLPRVTPKILNGCPSLESAVYQVSVTNSNTTLNGGCAYINYNSSGKMRQSFSLWFTSIENVEQRCQKQGIEYLNFYCLEKSLSPTEDTNDGRMKYEYIALYDGTPNKTGNPDHRCALYKTGNESSTTLRMAVSENDSCKGLLNILSHPKMKIPQSKNGSMLLFFNKTRVDKFEATTLADTTTTTESIESISKRFERRGYILQNFGNRPNPFHSRGKRLVYVLSRMARIACGFCLVLMEQRHALSYIIGGDGGDGGRGSVMFLHGSQLAMNEKDDSTNTATTTEDKNRLRQSLEIKHMQIRRRRSASSVKSTSKTDVPVLAGINPFSLILVNRGHNNKTGSIKPLGLWDQITKLFID